MGGTDNPGGLIAGCGRGPRRGATSVRKAEQGAALHRGKTQQVRNPGSATVWPGTASSPSLVLSTSPRNKAIDQQLPLLPVQQSPGKLLWNADAQTPPTIHL